MIHRNFGATPHEVSVTGSFTDDYMELIIYEPWDCSHNRFTWRRARLTPTQVGLLICAVMGEERIVFTTTSNGVHDTDVRVEHDKNGMHVHLHNDWGALVPVDEVHVFCGLMMHWLAHRWIGVRTVSLGTEDVLALEEER